MGKKNRSVELTFNGDGLGPWTDTSGRRKLYAEIVIGEDTYLYLTETEYRDLESRVLESQ